MSFGNLFVVLSSVGDVELDIINDEDHNYPARITRNPVEDGSEYSDNIVILPIILKMNARVSDASMIPLVPTFGSKAIDAYNALAEMQTTKEIVEVITGVRAFENMYLENLGIPRSSADGDSLRFELTLAELLIVGDETYTNRELISEDVEASALAASNAGTVQGSPV